MDGPQRFFVVAALLAAMASNSVLLASNAQTICQIPIDGLMACRPSVTPPNPTPPTPVCCSALSHANLTCLCSYKNSNVLVSFGIDPKLALQLPGKCNRAHPAKC